MRTPAIAIAATLVTSAVITGCGSSSAGPGAPPSATPVTSFDATAARAAITTSWQTFFNAKTPRATAEGYLEDGASLGPAIAFAARLQRQEHLKENAKVTKIVFIDATTASVTYNLVGTPLQGATGQAVYQGGKWLVSKNTFCGLVEIGAAGKSVPGCTP